MKLLLVLVLCAFVAAAPNVQKHEVIILDNSDVPIQNLNFMLDILIAQAINFIRNLINNGFGILGIPPLDPLNLEHFHLVVPAGLINLDLELQNIVVAGIGGFVVHSSKLDVNDISFDVDISVPTLDISTEIYNLTGDLLTAIPIFGNGRAEFNLEDFRIKAKFYLKQSEDEKSIIIDRVEGASFEIPSFKSNLNGAIGGGDIDAIVNAIIQEVIVDYVIRFRGAITNVASIAIPVIANPVLELFDTWQFLAPFLPNN